MASGQWVRNDDESDRKPTFGFMPNDGIVVPHQSVARALEIVKQALTNADFEGPIARSDGCPDVWEAIQQSGEPIFPEIVNVFPGGKRRPPIPLPEYEQVVLKMKDYRWKYNDYWQSSAGKTSSGNDFRVRHQALPEHANLIRSAC
ncbi:hypothetical protein QC761_0053770 [Podospora bellae-mahoneyi]|uniref:Uncharacterized protein n=1 Tax=Podospora bellae-mahoneyi TaxID=2093777 RepID=A0ABR0FKQ5_9PEZI|nr:hypothetical protein QC761_0053770 [Podospora bellae-mahoneyi]